jgi:hypothetical protein
MKGALKLAVMSAIFAGTSVIPMKAQISNGLTFTTTFPFYAGYAKMPAGTYTVRQSEVDPNTLQIESQGGKYSAFFDVIATQSESPHAKSDATFNRYDGVEYLNRLWIEGESSGLQVEPTKAEKKAAASGAPQQHSVPGTKR